MLKRLRQEFKQAQTLLQFGFMKGAGQVLGMIAPLIIAGFMRPEVFGSYALAKMVISFFVMLIIGSSQTPFIVYANRERAQTGVIRKSFAVQCIFLTFSGILFLSICVLFYRPLAAFIGISLGDSWFVALAFLGMLLRMFFDNLFLALGERLKNAMLALVHGSIVLCLVLALVFTHKMALPLVLAVDFAAGLLAVLFFVKSLQPHLLLPFQLDVGHFKSMFNFTKWVFVGGMAAYLINWGDNLVLRVFVSRAEIGQYNLAYQVFKGLAILTSVVATYFFPFISENIADAQKINKYFFSKRPRICAAGFVGIAILFVAVPHLFGLVYGGVYSQSAAVLQILLVGSALILYAGFYETVLCAVERYRFTQVLNVLQVALNLLLDFLLVPTMGIYGAAVATTVAYTFRVAIIEVYFRTKLKYLLQA